MKRVETTDVNLIDDLLRAECIAMVDESFTLGILLKRVQRKLDFHIDDKILKKRALRVLDNWVQSKILFRSGGGVNVYTVNKYRIEDK